MSNIADKLILHCDLNNFYASCECALEPSLTDVPLAVSGNAEKRHGIILAKNEKAKKLGVKTGEAIWQARQKAPDLVCVPPHFDLYMDYSRRVTEIYTRFTPQVEPFGPDECWLDATGCDKLFGDGGKMADTIRATVTKETGLTLSAGVSFNKIFAKIGSDLKKPDATTIISRENFREVLWGLSASVMMGIGKQTALKLTALNILTLGDLARADTQFMRAQFGILGEKMVENARGENTEPVRETVNVRVPESIGHGMTAIRDLTSYDDAETLIFYLCDKIGARLRKNNFRCNGVAIDMRDFNLTHITRQKTLNMPTCSSSDIARASIELLRANWNCSPPLRTITISTFCLTSLSDQMQMTMFDDASHDRAENLDKAIDRIKAKYGSSAITRANLILRDFIYDKNDSEDFLPFRR